MKELSIEDKAKRYDEAIKLAKDSYSYPSYPGFIRADVVFPELKESEDTDIREALYEYFKRYKNNGDIDETWNGLSYDKILSWLEKQDEQREINLVEILKHYPRETELYSPLYGKLWLAEIDEEHEIITCYKHPLDEGCTRAILEQEDIVSFYSNGTTGLPDFSISKDCMLFLYDIEKQGKQKSNGEIDNLHNYLYGEQKSTDKVEPKFKVGDEIKTANEKSLIITKIDEKGYWSEDLFICDFDEECLWDLVEQKSTWSEEDEKMLADACIMLEWYKGNNWWKAQYIKNWLKSIKERVQPKQELSEDTQHWIDAIIKDYEGLYGVNKDFRAIIQIKINILKSLKNRCTWKPSDKQIKGIECAIKTLQHQLNVGDKRLNSLYSDLMKLKE